MFLPVGARPTRPGRRHAARAAGHLGGDCSVMLLDSLLAQAPGGREVGTHYAVHQRKGRAAMPAGPSGPMLTLEMDSGMLAGPVWLAWLGLVGLGRGRGTQFLAQIQTQALPAAPHRLHEMHVPCSMGKDGLVCPCPHAFPGLFLSPGGPFFPPWFVLTTTSPRRSCFPPLFLLSSLPSFASVDFSTLVWSRSRLHPLPALPPASPSPSQSQSQSQRGSEA